MILDVAGQAPLVSPVEGQGCVSWNSRLTEVDRGSLAEAETGRAAHKTSVAQMSKAGAILSPTFAPG